MQMGKWTSEAEDFIKRFQKELPNKKTAIFVSSMKTVSEREGKTEDLEKARVVDLDSKIEKYSLTPLAAGFFGGVIDFNKMNFITRKAFGWIKPQLEKDGFKETSSGVYELRNWEEIRTWANDLAAKASQ
jgi:menaquinone-dependent protoporphyrinogen IX oxidase